MGATINYTTQDETKLKTLYAELGNEGMEKISAEMDRPLKSVRGKLIHMGEYIKPVKPITVKKVSEFPPKKEMLVELRNLTGRNLDGLLNATSPAINEVLTLVKEHNTTTIE